MNDITKLCQTYKEIADEAIALADEYAGHDSETVKYLKKQFIKAEKIEEKLNK